MLFQEKDLDGEYFLLLILSTNDQRLALFLVWILVWSIWRIMKMRMRIDLSCGLVIFPKVVLPLIYVAILYQTYAM